MGYQWDIWWKTKGGDQPLVGVSGEELVGSDVSIIAMPILDGGTWIRPIRGDMLRVPEEEPQVTLVLIVTNQFVPIVRYLDALDKYVS